MIILIIIIITSCFFSNVDSINICDIKSIDDIVELNTISKNTIPQNGNFYTIENSTDWYNCTMKCCSYDKCNLVYYKENKICYLIQCISSELCEPIRNFEKLPSTVDDFIIRIKKFDNTANEVKNECDPKGLNTCQINEICELNEARNEFKCNCKTDKYKRINGKCYEYLPNTQSCEINTNDCKKPFEVCLSSLNDYSPLGTCQCDIFYERDRNGDCFLQSSISSIPTKEFENHRKKVSTTEKYVQTTVSINQLPANSNQLVVANAGPDQYINSRWTRTCILNGSNSYTFSSKNKIVRWEWSKSESSPAVGNFAIVNGESTCLNEIAIFENLIDGDYTFVLKVWTNASSNHSNHYSQSSMQVLVHSSDVNSTTPEIYKNSLLKLDLNLNPLKFLDVEKLSLLTNIQLILKQNLKQKQDINPKIIVINQEILKKYSKSGISIEFYVLNEINHQVIDSSLVMKILYKLAFKSGGKFLKLNEQISGIENSNDLLIFDNLFHNQLVYDLKQMKCLNNCSEHGYCDQFTYVCVCDRYWFFNIYKYYFSNYDDETYGNNCEWNLVFLFLACLFTLFTTTLFMYLSSCCCCCCSKQSKKIRYNSIDDEKKKFKFKESCFKKFFCCICRCCCKNNRFLNKATNLIESNELHTKRSDFKYSLLENKDDSFQFSVGAKKSKEEYNFGLNSSDDDDYPATSTKTSNNRFKNNQDAEEIEEDVLYDQNKQLFQNIKTKLSKNNIS